jgi:OFA family oxalate/formate antiporter-like MFS transporter
MIKKVFYGWWIVLSCFIIGLYVSGIVHFGFTAFFGPLIKEFGWSYTQISFAKSLRGLEMSVFAPLLGFLADRYGSRKLILCGTITVGLGLILLSMTQSLAMFYASFLLLSFGAGGCTAVVLMTAVANWFSKDIGKAFGIVAAGSGAGGLMVPLVVQMIDVYDWRTTLIIFGLGIWLLGIPLSFIVRDKPERCGYLPHGESPHVPTQDVKNKDEGKDIRFKEALKHKAFLYINIVELIRHMIVTAVILHIMPYLSSVGIPRSLSGMVAAALPVVSIFGRLSFGWFGDAYDKRAGLAVTLCLIGAGLMAFSFVQQGWLMFVFIISFSLGWGGSAVLSRTILREYFGRESFGKIVGITMGVGSVGGIIGPVLAGWTFDTLRSYHFLWLVFCGFSGLSIWLISRVKPVNTSG